MDFKSFCSFSVDMKYIQQTALSVFEKLLKTHIAMPLDSGSVPFADFFDVIVNISSTVGAKGHVLLLKSVQRWIDVR